MSASASVRTRAEPDRGPSTAFGARSRVPSSRVNAKERVPSSGEVVPEDSASNAPSKRIALGGSSNHVTSRMQTERHSVQMRQTNKERVQVRTRSPVKTSYGNGRGAADGPLEPPRRVASQTESTHGKEHGPNKALRRFLINE